MGGASLNLLKYHPLTSPSSSLSFRYPQSVFLALRGSIFVLILEPLEYLQDQDKQSFFVYSIFLPVYRLKAICHPEICITQSTDIHLHVNYCLLYTSPSPRD